MVISRKGFLRFAVITGLGFLLNGMARSKEALFAATDTPSPEEMYKVGDKVPGAGRYQCIVCSLIVEYLPKHIEKGATFGICPLCHAGAENGPKKPEEAFWKYIG